MKDSFLATRVCHLFCDPTKMTTKQRGNFTLLMMKGIGGKSLQISIVRKHTGAEKWRKEVTDDVGGGQRRRQQDSCTPPCRTRGGSGLADTVRGRGRRHSRRWSEGDGPAAHGTASSQQQACSQGYARRWRVQCNASRAGASPLILESSCDAGSLPTSHLTWPASLLNMKRKRSSDIWKKKSLVWIKDTDKFGGRILHNKNI